MAIIKRKVDYPEDVAYLKRHVPPLKDLPDLLVDRLYSDFSEDMYCAGWLAFTASEGPPNKFMKQLLNEFQGWLAIECGIE